MTTYSSIPTQKRVPLLDILRGFALLGILIVNANDYRLSVRPGAPGFNELNVWFNNIIIAIGDGSFYPLFSLLFGIGFAIWMDKSIKANGGVWRFAWRSFILFLLGCLFYVFIEDRNILIRYSFLSIPLLLFYKAGPKILLAGVVIFLLLAAFHRPIWNEINKNRSQKTLIQIKKDQQVVKEVWKLAEKNKDYKSFVRARYTSLPGEIKMCYTFSHPTLPLIFSMFLLGVFFWRKELFTQVEKYTSLWKKIFWFGLVLGVGGNLYVFIMRMLGFKRIFMPDGEILNYVQIIANPALTLFYVSLFGMLLRKTGNNQPFTINALNATGRIPLTNYFLQYIIMSVLMLPYGFNLDERLFSQHLLLLAIIVLLFQVIISVYWTKQFIYGPMEWLWRSLTYMSLQRMKK